MVAVIGFAFIWWIAGARKWFKGPKIQGTAEARGELRFIGASVYTEAEELAAIEADLTQFDAI